MHDYIEARYHWLHELTTQLSAEDQETIIAALTHLTEAAKRLAPIEVESEEFAPRPSRQAKAAYETT
jgi:deferrochelatase/peroxidase EfeB